MPEHNHEHDHNGDPDHARGAGHIHVHVPKGASPVRALSLSLAVTAGFCCVEIVGAHLSDSLALLSDAMHMLLDVSALAIALVATLLARLRGDTRQTYGYSRVEVVAALVNALLLVVVAAHLFVEAVERFQQPPHVNVGLMMTVSGVGLLSNAVSLKLLAGRRENLNIRAAFLHVVGDLLSSASVLAGGALIYWTGERRIDAALSVIIGTVIAVTAFRLIRDSALVLIESAPRDIDVAGVDSAIRAIEGVVEVHDLHVWSLSGNDHQLTAHVIACRSVNADALQGQLRTVLRDRFSVEHSTLQIELQACDVGEQPVEVG